MQVQIAEFGHTLFVYKYFTILLLQKQTREKY